MSNKTTKAAVYMADREQGLSYRQIAAKHGVSYQAVAQACSKYSPGHFRPFTAEQVVYPNLRRWLNENKVSRGEFIRRMGLLPEGPNFDRVRNWFSGRCYPIKKVIDKMLEVTGLTYEQLWETEVAHEVD